MFPACQLNCTGDQEFNVTFSTKKPLTLPFSPFSTSLAQITNKPATGEFEIQVLDPFKVYPSLVLTAVVSIEEGSEP